MSDFYPATSSDNQLHILHIEDDEFVQMAITRVLSRLYNATVTTVSTGEEAIAAMASKPWAVVISDWNIKGGMTGGDVYEVAKTQHPKLAEKYIFLSDSEPAEALSAKQGLLYLEKPVYTNVLRDAVDTVLKVSRL